MISSILLGLAHVANIVFNLAVLLVIVSVGISWFNADPYNQYVRLVRNLTEPVYRPFRRWTSRIGGPIDIAPMIVMIIIVFLQKSIPAYLMYLHQQLR
jgi:YggT family protein